MGKDFSGNVFLINLDKWDVNPLKGEKKQVVQPSFYFHIIERYKELLDFISDLNHASGKSETLGLENTFVKLFIEHRKGTIQNTFNKLKDKISIIQFEEIIKKISNNSNYITLPTNILERNLTISPYRQQQMYDYLFSEITQENFDILIPKHPNTEWETVRYNFEHIIKKMHEIFEGVTHKTYKYFAPLALLWIRGLSLSSMIDNSFTFKKAKALREGKKAPSINSVIREVMDNIENDIRFRYVKFFSCYIDLLKEAFKNSNKINYIERVPAIPLFLELGASSETMINFISLGLSRTTASILSSSSPIALNRTQSLLWLQNIDIENLAISNICKRELKKLLGK